MGSSTHSAHPVSQRSLSSIPQRQKEKARLAPGPLCCMKLIEMCLLGSHLFRFAFLAHKLEFALGGFDFGRNFLLYAGCRFFQLG